TVASGVDGGIRTLVPGGLGDVALGGSQMRIVSRIPVGGRTGGVCELGAADGDVIRRRSQAVDAETVAGGSARAGIVAARGTGIARRDKYRDPLRGGLLPQRVVERVARAHVGFAKAEAHAQYGRQVVVDDVLTGKIHTVGSVCAGGDHELDGGSFGHAAGPFHVEIGLHLFAGADNPGILTVEDHLRIVGGQTEGGTEGRYVGELDVGASGDGDGLAAAVQVGTPELRDVLDGGEIVGAEPARPAIQIGGRVGHLPQHLVHRLVAEIVQRHHATDYRRQGFGDRHIGRVGEVANAGDLVLAHLDVESAFHLAGGTA